MRQELWVIPILLIIGIGVVILPKKIQKFLADTLSLRDWGIRYSTLRRDHVDTLTNILLSLCFLISIFCTTLPSGKIIFMGSYGIIFLFLVSQMYRISMRMKKTEKNSMLVALTLMCLVAFLSATILVGKDTQMAYKQFLLDIQESKITNFTYWFSSYQPIYLIHQWACYCAAFYVVLAQFKYMRLEKHYKATTIVNLWIKVLFVCLILIACSLGFSTLIQWVYYI